MQRLNQCGKITCCLFLILLGLCSWTKILWALSPEDIIVIFNANLIDSQAVAAYYADKRGVPAANLLGVAVGAAESMSRTDFDNKLIPPVRNLARKLQAEGRTATLLLVYGLPLLVAAPETAKPDKDFLALAENRSTECRKQMLHIIRELEEITPGPNSGSNRPSQPQEPSSNQELLRRARESGQRSAAYLDQLQKNGGDEGKREKIFSLLLNLAGTDPLTAAWAQRPAPGADNNPGRGQDQELSKRRVRMGLTSAKGFFGGISPAKALEIADSRRFLQGLGGELIFWDQVKSAAGQGKQAVAVDSELSLVMTDYNPQARWLPNPFQAQYDNTPFIKEFRTQTLMVSRLDGPTPAIARRLVDDAMAVENSGLEGVLYIDARGLQDKGKIGSYPWFDQHLVNLYQMVKDRSTLRAVIDGKPRLFGPGACPHAALYCGWYSVGKYIDSFQWQQGAVGYHVASNEATTLKKPGSTVWCKRMLEEGVAATLGPVAEPYLMAFPLPDQFFPLLMTGKLPLVEVYFRTLPLIAWRMILIGDPLYTPFKKNPALKSIEGKDLESN